MFDFKKLAGATLAAAMVMGLAPAAHSAIMVQSANCALNADVSNASIGVATACAIASKSERSDINNIFLNGSQNNFDNVLATAPAGDFFSLGRGGGMVLEFTPEAVGNGEIVEVTFGAGSAAESVKISGANMADFSDAAELVVAGNADKPTNTSTVIPFNGNTYKYLLFLDTSGAASEDGYDIVALNISQVPLPAAGLLLLGGLGGLGFVSRKRKAA